MKKILLLSLVVLVAGAFAFVFWKQESLQDKNTISIRGHEFQVEIADTPEKRALGLGNRADLCENCGMLFEFEKEGN